MPKVSNMIETPRLILRHWLESDTEPFIKLNQDKEVRRYFPNTLTVEETITAIEKIKHNFATRGFSWYAVELKENHKFIGFIGLEVPSFEACFTPCIEIGWRLAREYWGQGLAVEGAQKCLEIGFNEHNFKEIVAFTPKINTPSQRVMQKLGMSYNPADDFYHPKLPKESPLSLHVLYRLHKKDFS
jgi:RimJ/RimL family protein N-acetyltransferase